MNGIKILSVIDIKNNKDVLLLFANGQYREIDLSEIAKLNPDKYTEKLCKSAVINSAFVSEVGTLSFKKIRISYNFLGQRRQVYYSIGSDVIFENSWEVEVNLPIGTQIQNMRLLKHLTQSDLAVKTGIAVSHLSVIERNKTNPNLQTIEKIAKALDRKIQVKLQ
jgi:DNA-binding XRE family transcriptional regulator